MLLSLLCCKHQLTWLGLDMPFSVVSADALACLFPGPISSLHTLAGSRRMHTSSSSSFGAQAAPQQRPPSAAAAAMPAGPAKGSDVPRINIGVFGVMNAGKSTLMNAITRQETSIVDATPGTTAGTVQSCQSGCVLIPRASRLNFLRVGLHGDSFVRVMDSTVAHVQFWYCCWGFVYFCK